jgi:tetratricopeptide (TPR) repeat protein
MQRLFLCFMLFVGCRAIPASLTGESAQDYINRGNALRDQGENDKAIAAFTEAIRLDPKDDSAYFNRGLAWRSKGEYDNAIMDYNQALTINPAFFQVYVNRGVAWSKKGEYDQALTDYNQALRLRPNDASTYNNFAWLQATCPDAKYRDGKKAIENASRACQTDAGHWYCIGTLAAAYAESGDFERAKSLQTSVIQMAATDKSVTDKDKAEMNSRLELYKQNKPYRDELKKNSAS